MSGGSTATQNVPSNKVVGNDDITFAVTDNAERVVPIGDETASVAIAAHPDNSGIIYVGFDDEMSEDSGFPLVAGTTLSMDIDANQEGIFALADTIGDEVRWIALG